MLSQQAPSKKLEESMFMGMKEEVVEGICYSMQHKKMVNRSGIASMAMGTVVETQWSVILI